MPDPAAVRVQRSSFLASLNRTISPPPGTPQAPIVVDPSSDDDAMPQKKKQRLQPLQPLPKEAPGTTQAQTLQGTGARKLIASPFQLTKIQDLPDTNNIDTVTLHDILGNPLIREAWIFNYCFDVDWTMQHFDSDIRNTVSVRIIHGSWKNEDRNKKGIDDACRRWSNVQAIQAYLPDAFGTHHTKMIVLFRHDDVAEVIIHTANMQSGDWTHATQAVWRSPNLPLLTGSSDIGVSGRPVLGSGERFKWDLLRYLKAYGKSLGALVQETSKHDFCSVRGALIGSAPSKIKNVYGEDASAICWGHPAVYHALKEIRQQRTKFYAANTSIIAEYPHIACQCSSVATLKAGWLQDTLLRAIKAVQPNTKHTLSIVYPTVSDVGASLDGYSCGGSVHMKIQSAAHQKQVAALRPHLCRWTRGSMGEHALREYAAPHIKTYISFESEPTAASPAPAVNWALLTSANLSIQAWGSEAKMPAEKGRKKSKFNATEAEVHIQSYELGVLVWPELWADRGSEGLCAMVPCFGKDMPDTKHAEIASNVVGLRMPYDLPLTPYTANDIPWSPNVPHPEPDRYGKTWPPDESWFEQ